MRQIFNGITILLSVGAIQASAEILYPSIYYSPIINKQTMHCEEVKIHNILDVNQNTIETLCHKEYKDCEFQGSCVVIDGDNSKTLNFISYNTETEQTYFAIIDNKKCQFGSGIKGACLDPFYSVAADLTKHMLGDVLFVPKIKGAKLPSGEIHNGFVIVRDSSRLLTGAGVGNIAFFTGHLSDKDSTNTFANLGLGNLDNTSVFRKATAKEAIKIRKERNYPFLNKN